MQSIVVESSSEYPAPHSATPECNVRLGVRDPVQNPWNTPLLRDGDVLTLVEPATEDAMEAVEEVKIPRKQEEILAELKEFAEERRALLQLVMKVGELVNNELEERGEILLPQTQADEEAEFAREVLVTRNDVFNEARRTLKEEAQSFGRAKHLERKLNNEGIGSAPKILASIEYTIGCIQTEIQSLREEFLDISYGESESFAA